MTIHVTQKDIDVAKAFFNDNYTDGIDAKFTPLALAARRITKSRLTEDGWCLYGGIIFCRLSRRAMKFSNQWFDPSTRSSVVPQSFRLNMHGMA